MITYIDLDKLNTGDLHIEYEILKSHLDPNGNKIIDEANLKSISLNGTSIYYLEDKII